MEIIPGLTIDDDELIFRFVRASGPGGQNVNKTSTAVQLRFDVRHSPSLPEDVRERLFGLAGERINRRGVLVIDARRYRSQERNRQDAMDRLATLVRRAATPARKRRPTNVPKGERERRLSAKHRRSRIKDLRSKRLDE